MAIPNWNGYSNHDVAIWRTIQLNEYLNAGRLEDWPEESVSRAPSFADDEIYLARGPYQLFKPHRSQAAGYGYQTVAGYNNWQPVRDGSVLVSQYGYYLSTAQGFSSTAWRQINQMDLVGPRQLHLVLTNQNELDNRLLISDWAEMIFMLWAWWRHPRHPQYGGATWIPQGWVQRTRMSPHDLPEVLGADSIFAKVLGRSV